ncbi:MAG: class I SAM-dependent methyltransferase [Gaiellaceae bacterium]
MSGTAVVLGAAHVRRSLPQLEEFDEIVVLDQEVDALERVMDELADPRLDYLLGALPVLPLPDGSVDLVIGADGADPEVGRVLGPGGRAEPGLE